MNEQITLLDQIIEMAQQEDQELKRLRKLVNQASETTGISSIVFHLLQLKDLILNPPKTTLVLDGKEYKVSLG